MNDEIPASNDETGTANDETADTNDEIGNMNDENSASGWRNNVRFVCPTNFGEYMNEAGDPHTEGFRLFLVWL